MGIDWTGLVRQRHLIGIFVRKDLDIKYQNLLLGPLWMVIQPIVSAFVFATVFHTIAGVSTNGVPAVLFFLSGILLWGFFHRCVTHSAHAFLGNKFFFSKVYIPRLIMPISSLAFHFVEFLPQMVVFVLVGSCIGYAPASPLSVAFSIAQVLALALGLGLIIASLSVKLPDVQFSVPFFLQMGMFVSAVFYPLSITGGPIRKALLLNPFVVAAETFRSGMFGLTPPGPLVIVGSFLETALLLFLGLLLFGRAEAEFMDEL